jgi:hypothetical protein
MGKSYRLFEENQLATSPVSIMIQEEGETYRSIVHVEVSLLDTFSMVTLWVGQTKEAFLEEGTKR